MIELQRESILRPQVTVITATFNAAKTLEACLSSVRTQDYLNVQHVLVDGGSKDGTVELLERHATAGNWISEPDRGIYDAWNKGLAMATGDWICFLGADDVLLPDAISSYMRLAREKPQARYLSSRVRWISPSGRARLIGKPWSWPSFRRYMCTAHPGSMHHRSLFERHGRYDSSLRIVGDYEFLLRAGASLETAFLPCVTVEMQGGGTSDNIKALDEARQVKVTTGLRTPWIASMERCIARQMFRIRHALLP